LPFYSVGYFFSNKISTTLIKPKKRKIDKILGADISFFYQNWKETGAESFMAYWVLKRCDTKYLKKGFNYIRLRIFNNPAANSGYSPHKGFADADATGKWHALKAGLKFLLDFHYSDTWADPVSGFKTCCMEKR